MGFPEIATHHHRPWYIFGLALLLAAACPAEGFKATIRANGTQGDLVQIHQEGKDQTLRLYGVACPVSGQPLSESATTRILEAAMDASVTVEIVGKDSDGTPVAWVRLPDGTSLNEHLVRDGLAWWDSPNTPEEHPLQKAATEAIAAKRGLWAGAAPLAPWDYRASHSLPEVKYGKLDTESGPSETATMRPPVVPSLEAHGEKKAQPADEGDYFPEDPAEHMALMLKHQPRIAYDKAGKPLGLTATDIASVPGAKRIGLQDGDIVSTVNGIALTDAAQVLGMVTQFQGAKQLELTVIRQGKPTKITIPLE